MRTARIPDEDGGGFGLEYDNTLGKENAMRPDAFGYENAIREARSFLRIKPDDFDADGVRCQIG